MNETIKESNYVQSPKINIQTPVGPVDSKKKDPVIRKKTIVPHLKNNCKQLLWIVPLTAFVVLLALYAADIF